MERSIIWVGVEKDSKTLRVDIPGGVGGDGFIKPPFTGYDPQFAHVALVWDPENAQARLYLNGTQAAVGVIADDAFNITNRLTDITLIIGRSKYDGHRVNSWDGQIGEVRVYDRALSNANVKTLFRTTGPRGSSQTAWNGGDA